MGWAMAGGREEHNLDELGHFSHLRRERRSPQKWFIFGDAVGPRVYVKPREGAPFSSTPPTGAPEPAPFIHYVLSLLPVAFCKVLDLEEQFLRLRWLRNWTLGPDLPAQPLPMCDLPTLLHLPASVSFSAKQGLLVITTLHDCREE